MTKALFLFLLLGTFNIFANESSYVLEYSLSKKSLTLKISTVAIFETSCELNTTGLNIVGPDGFNPGVIDVVIIPTSNCREIQAPHSMTLELPRGKTLPQIPNGFYNIYINGQFYQAILVLPGRGSETGNG